RLPGAGAERSVFPAPGAAVTAPAPPRGWVSEPGAGPMGVAIIGAGNVSGQYLPSLLSYPDLAVRGIADLDVQRAMHQADAYGIPLAGSVDDVLSLADIDLIVNLTVPAAHAEVALAAIESGHHVWGEKPLAADRASARAVLEAAEGAGVMIGNAPDT